MIEFYLNGQPEKLDRADPNMSILDWLRTKKRLSGTKEGCASGDCGACTVLLGSPADDAGAHYTAINSCISLIGSLHGKHLITVDALSPEQAHPVQQAMVECSGSQCGFCTPGFIMSMVGLHQQVAGSNSTASEHQLMEALAGNLCRCTGYRPILEAGRRTLVDAVQHWDGAALFEPAPAQTFSDTRARAASLEDDQGKRFDAPVELSELRSLLAANPDARLVAGSTDLALEITQQLKTLPQLISVEQVAALHALDCDEQNLTIGSAATYSEFAPTLCADWPAFAGMLERLGSLQVRNRGTLGGNIGNASPIGDMPPPLIALGAQIQLDGADGERWLALEDFFVDYKKTRLAPGEFIRAVQVPRPQDNQRLFIYKISKRLDDDISAVLGAFWLQFDGDTVSDCRLAFGGMAGIPKRATAAEAALRGAVFDDTAVAAAQAALASDFSPLSDVRASASYRMSVAGNLLLRALLESRAGETGAPALTVTDYA
ncbi:xanthine dehydrogenase small subunit [Pseudomonas sp.]|uniref:xanthine dehydrogenase small subunit n=1 Tax=Pseudomonas sp. TaxID=306 RepID=UPI003CC55EC0